MPKITALTADTAPTSDDLAVIVNDPAGTPGTKKATLANVITKAHGLSDGIVSASTGTLNSTLSLDTDVTLAADSNTKIPSQKAVKTYTDNILGSANALVYKGTIDCSANPNYPAGDAGFLYVVSVAGKIGGASGIEVEVGDMAICNTDGTVTGDQATVGQYWNIIQKNIVGAVTGPVSSTNNNVAFFDGTTGKIIKDSGLALSGTNTGDETQSTIKTKLGSATTSVDGYLTSTDWNTFNGKQTALGFTPEDVANKSTNTSLGTSNSLYPSQNAVKSYVDTGLGTKLSDVVSDTTPQLGGNLDLNEKAISVIATAGESVVAGNLLYLKNDGKYWKASNTSETTSTTSLAIANASISADATGEVIVYGTFTTTGLTAGSNYFVGAGGAITTTTPTTEDYVIRPIGTALSTTKLIFNPTTSWITYKA